VFPEHLLDLSRVDVLAAGDDEIVPAVDHVEIPVVIEVARVSSAKPAFGNGMRSRQTVAQITGKDGRSPDLDLTDLSRARDSSWSGDPELGERKRQAGGRRPARRLVR
jgi:hypothetical protein